MRFNKLRWIAGVGAFALGMAACGGSVATGGSGGSGSGAHSSSSASAAQSSSSAGTGGADAGVDKAAGCTGTFGNALTNSFGRLDGTVLAVVQPKDTQCPMPNSDHVILEVTMMGAAYRMVVNVRSPIGDPNVRFLALPHALPPPAWAEGWHTGLTLDYVADLGVHVGVFTPYNLTDLSALIADSITIGQKVSVYATSSGGASTHLIHRNDGKADGAIVLDPEAMTPKFLIFHFADQMF